MLRTYLYLVLRESAYCQKVGEPWPLQRLFIRWYVPESPFEQPTSYFLFKNMIQNSFIFITLSLHYLLLHYLLHYPVLVFKLFHLWFYRTLFFNFYAFFKKNKTRYFGIDNHSLEKLGSSHSTGFPQSLCSFNLKQIIRNYVL